MRYYETASEEKRSGGSSSDFTYTLYVEGELLLEVTWTALSSDSKLTCGWDSVMYDGRRLALKQRSIIPVDVYEMIDDLVFEFEDSAPWQEDGYCYYK